MVVERNADAARRNPAAGNLEEVPVTASAAPVAPYAETVSRMVAFAEGNPEVAGFGGVSYVSHDGSVRTRDFVVSRLPGVAGETVVVRPDDHWTALPGRVACEECGGSTLVGDDDCQACGGTGLPPA